MDQENLNYLKNISDKVVEYDNVRAIVMDYILENKIQDVDLATNLFVVGFLWQANKRNDVLTDDDLIMLLDAENDLEEFEIDEFREYFLEDEHKELSLIELLDLLMEESDEFDEDELDDDEDDSDDEFEDDDE
jgi:hypothetical protein